MEEKKQIKVSLGTAICVFIITILIVALGVVYYLGFIQNTENKTVIEQNNMAKENTIETQNKNELQEEKSNSENEKFVVPSLYTGNFKNKKENLNYSLYIEENKMCNISIKDGTPYVSWITYDEHSAIKFLEEEFNMTLSDKSQKITGFTKKVVDAYIGYMGQSVVGITFIFQMEDGTLEYSTIENMMKNTSTQGAIKGLNNIIKLQNISEGNEEEGGGGLSVVAIDKDNNIYDLDDYIPNN